MKRLLLIAGMCLSANAFAWGVAGLPAYQNYYNQAAQAQLMQAQTQALQAYTACMRETPGNCGTPPQATYAPPAPQPVYHQQQTHCYSYGGTTNCTTTDY